MGLDLLANGVEVGVVTTNVDAMVDFYGSFLGLPHQADLGFPGGTMRRYAIGPNVLKLVSYDAGHPVVEPPTDFAAVPGMGWCFVADPDGNWVELVGPIGR